MNTAKTKITDAQQAANDLYSFISENEQNIIDGSVVSFVLPVNKINLIAKLSVINDIYDEFFFFEKFDEGYSIAVLNCLIELSSNKKDILSLENDISKLKSQLVSNWSDYNINNIPIVSGGIKFDSEKSSSEWDNFRAIHFFVPQIIILQKEDETFLIYNFLANSKINNENIVINFTQSVSAIFNLDDEGTVKKNIAYESNSEINNNKSLWNSIVTEAKKKLNRDLKKIVLSRKIEFLVKDDIDWTQMFRELETSFSNCYLFMLKSNKAVFFGASPEKFLSVRDNKIEIDALAGSAPRNSTDVESELLNKKNIKEHRYVIDFISQAMSEYAHDIRVDTCPQIKKLKNVQHLYTKINAKLNEDRNVLSLIDSMFPTPAVCGLPKQIAHETINEIEKFDRGLFSGLIGWIDINFNCEFAVAIRSALYKKGELHLYAGAGIVEESVPEEEYIETEMKFNTILSLFHEQNKG
ncbi:MAG: isochorismate synthase [Ignavibacteriaceae bacterium]